MYKRRSDFPTTMGKSSTSFRAKVLITAIGLLSVLPVLGVSGPANAAAEPQVKPAPVAPQLPAFSADKPAPDRSNPAPAPVGWVATLTASSTSLWPTQYSTLTAHSNFDVGPTPYWLRIHDNTSNTYIATCGAGTSCPATVTFANATTHSYTAVISYNVVAYPPTGLQASSAPLTVTWRSISVTLAASPTTVNVGATSTLTATTSADVGPTPFYTEIFDLNTGTRIGVCGGGTSCPATTSQAVATTHRFIAYVSAYSTTLPPAGVQARSFYSFVTWANTGYRVSLAAPAFSFGSSVTATATTNVNVGPTPYWIQVFNADTGARLAVCGSGTTCSATFTPAVSGTHLVAFVSANSTSYLPPSIQANSNVTKTSRLILTRPL